MHAEAKRSIVAAAAVAAAVASAVQLHRQVPLLLHLRRRRHQAAAAAARARRCTCGRRRSQRAGATALACSGKGRTPTAARPAREARTRGRAQSAAAERSARPATPRCHHGPRERQKRTVHSSRRADGGAAEAAAARRAIAAEGANAAACAAAAAALPKRAMRVMGGSVWGGSVSQTRFQVRGERTTVLRPSITTVSRFPSTLTETSRRICPSCRAGGEESYSHIVKLPRSSEIGEHTLLSSSIRFRVSFHRSTSPEPTAAFGDGIAHRHLFERKWYSRLRMPGRLAGSSVKGAAK